MKPRKHGLRGRWHIDGNGDFMRRNQGEEGVYARQRKGKFLVWEGINKESNSLCSLLTLGTLLNRLSLGIFIFFP